MPLYRYPLRLLLKTIVITPDKNISGEAAPANQPPLFSLASISLVQVSHLPPGTASPLAIDAEQFNHLKNLIDVESSAPNDIVLSYEALRLSKPSSVSISKLNIRWRIAFVDSNQQTLLSVYLDDFGLNGQINKTPVKFADLTLIRWLYKRFSR